jgi:hypothetical protein
MATGQGEQYVRRLARASFAGSSDGTGSIRGRFRRAFAALAGTGSLALVLALLVAPAASAAPWGFEQVTPVNKGGGSVSSVDTFQASPDGERFLYSTTLPFDAVPSESVPLYVRYLGARGPDAWGSRALDAPYKLPPGSSGTYQAITSVGRASYDLSYVLVTSPFALAPGGIEDGGNLYIRNTRTGEYKLVAASPDSGFSGRMSGSMGATSLAYVSSDGTEAIFTSSNALLPDVPVIGFTQGAFLYGWTEEDGLRVLSRNEGGDVVTGGTAVYSETGARSQMPDVGGLDHVYISRESQENGSEGVYERTGNVTKPISVSHRPGDPSDVVPGVVKAVADHGKYMLFETIKTTPLTTDTPEFESPNLRHLYRYDYDADALTYIGTADSVNRVIQMTQDGQTIAFQSTMDLGGAAIDGRWNIYVWRNGSLQFVDAPEPEGTASIESNFRRMLSPSGRYLVFTDSSKELAEVYMPSNVSSGCPDFFEAPSACDQVYVFDADAASEKLMCASCRTDGQLPTGRAGDPATANSASVRMNAYQTRDVADDGTVFFTTSDALLPAEDGNGTPDVYSYKDGTWTLLSRATQGTSARFLDATPDGKTVFFSTNDPISPYDDDRAVDIYVTREGAGYPYIAPEVDPPCIGVEACHNGLSPRSGDASGRTSSFEGAGNETPKAPLPKVRIATPKAATGKTATLRIKAPGRGTLTVTGKGVRKATRSTSKAGPVKVKVKLNAAAAKALARSGQVKQKVTVRFRSKSGESSSGTVQITFRAQASKKGGR